MTFKSKHFCKEHKNVLSTLGRKNKVPNNYVIQNNSTAFKRNM